MQSGTKRAPGFTVPEKSRNSRYQDMSTNTREKEYLVMGKLAGADSQKLEVYSLWAVQAFVCVILGKLLYLASPFLPKNWRRNNFPLHREHECGEGTWYDRGGSSANNQNKVCDWYNFPVLSKSALRSTIKWRKLGEVGQLQNVTGNMKEFYIEICRIASCWY